MTRVDIPFKCQLSDRRRWACEPHDISRLPIFNLVKHELPPFSIPFTIIINILPLCINDSLTIIIIIIIINIMNIIVVCLLPAPAASPRTASARYSTSPTTATATTTTKEKNHVILIISTIVILPPPAQDGKYTLLPHKRRQAQTDNH